MLDSLLSRIFIPNCVAHCTALNCNNKNHCQVIDIIFAFSTVQRPTWFPDILGNSSYPIFTKFGMQFIGLIACMGLLLVMIAL